MRKYENSSDAHHNRIRWYLFAISTYIFINMIILKKKISSSATFSHVDTITKSAI